MTRIQIDVGDPRQNYLDMEERFLLIMCLLCENEFPVLSGLHPKAMLKWAMFLC